MDTSFLWARGVVKRYGAVTALSDVALAVGSGEIVALAGENGSGKSTLAKVLAGVIRPDEGELELDRTPVAFRGPRDAVGAGIALVTQDPTAVPEMSVADNVMLGSGRRPWDIVRRRDVARAAQPFLRRVGIDASPSTLVRSLPPGQRELVEIAKALVTAPRLLILDEATSRFGEDQVQRLFDLVREEVDRGMAAILITHRLREITQIADRAVVLRDGHRVAELARDDLTEQRLSAAMVGRPRPERIAHGSPKERGRVALRVRELVVDPAAEPISFDVHEGEIVGLAGLVGSGRTEVLEAIAGAAPRLGGTVEVGGRAVAATTPRAAIDAGITLVPEDRHRAGLIMGASIRRNVALGSWRWNRPAGARNEEVLARQAIKDLSIKAPSSRTPVSALSGGNQQKVVLGRCLATRPKLLLLDDPTVGVDVGARDELYDVIAGLCRDGMAVLMASSELPELLRLADRVCVMHERSCGAVLDAHEATEERIAYLSGGGI